jgi:hypothetical protein
MMAIIELDEMLRGMTGDLRSAAVVWESSENTARPVQLDNDRWRMLLMLLKTTTCVSTGNSSIVMTNNMCYA